MKLHYFEFRVVVFMKSTVAARVVRRNQDVSEKHRTGRQAREQQKEAAK